MTTEHDTEHDAEHDTEHDVGAGPGRAVVFDLFGVLARHQDPAGRVAVEALLGVSDDRERLWRAYWDHRAPYDRGEVDAGTWWADVAGEVGCAVGPGLAGRLSEADVASWSRIDDEAVALAERLLDGGRQVALLSNAPVDLADRVRSAQPWLSRFGAVVFSCDVGAAKPEPAAFAAVERALGRGPDQLLLVDDRAENVAAARSRGWAGLVFTGLPALVDALGG